MAGALEGYTVVDLTTGAAGALATLLLGDHGARVIRVIGPDADAFRGGGFVVWDRAKECVRVDLREVASGTAGGEARAAFERLVGAADVLVEDFAPAAAARECVDEGRLRRLNPGLVTCSVTAYGMRGPWKDEPPVDDLVLARLGILGSMPGFREPPVHLVHPLPSVGAAVLAALGVSAALYAREGDRRGRTVETSLMAGALLYHPKVTGERLAPHTFQTHPSGSAPFYSNYECADGRWVQLGCVHAGFIAAAGALMGIEEILAEPRFGDGRAAVSPEADAELRAIIAGIVRRKPYTVWAREFEEADVPFALARWTEESIDDPQVEHNEMLVELDDPARGRVAQMGVGLTLTGTPGAVRGPRQDALPRNRLPGDLPPPAGGAPPPGEGGVLDPPLTGVRVLEITNLIAGPTGGRLLADLGADVVKLEPPGGDMSRPIGRTYFYSVNFNKRSLCVDTRTAEGKEVVQRVAASSDALLANLRPHATERMGITAEVNPALIEVHLTGYGWTGPYSRRPGIDPLAQALMGLQRAQGGMENPPVFHAQLAPTDFTTGAVGALGTVLCLLARRRTGVVQRAESNLLNGGILLCSQWFSRYPGRASRPLADKEQLGLDPFHRLFRVADGWIYVAADEEGERDALCAMLGCPRPGEAALEGRHPNEGPLADALAASFVSLTVADSLARLGAAGVPAAPALAGDSEIFLGHPHAREGAMVAERHHPSAGALQVAWNYVRFAGTRATAGRPTPLLGQDTRAVLAEVGIDPGRIERLHAAGVVKTEAPGG